MNKASFVNINTSTSTDEDKFNNHISQRQSDVKARMSCSDATALSYLVSLTVLGPNRGDTICTAAEQHTNLQAELWFDCVPSVVQEDFYGRRTASLYRQETYRAVSYTHLTLPTIYSV